MKWQHIVHSCATFENSHSEIFTPWCGLDLKLLSVHIVVSYRVRVAAYRVISFGKNREMCEP
jgi:hypothetical protein